MSAPDFAVVGGGIVGCALAAFLAEGGASVTLYERDEIAAGASGRNSGVVQDPLDPELTGLYEESLQHYRELEGFDLPEHPSGLLLISDEPFEHDGAEPIEDPQRMEPALQPGLFARRIDTGRPVPPAAAAHAWAQRARNAGARIELGAEGPTSGPRILAAGPWTKDLVDLPITPVWGVVVDLELDNPPGHVLEEAGIDALTTDDVPDVLFSAVTARGISAIGSTFLPDRPDPDALAPEILANAKRFLADLGRVRGLRACARPGSADGRPMLGQLEDELYVASGHGAWGITLGPASARLVADLALGRPAAIPPALDVRRFGFTS
ncbi:FAD-binding oxidoreductase [Solirubrobacter sp. CPCC 204708]|uniref:FAD-binding oxidoreductase n=1 Tax=Solirubrobacter deserti TaxID=2282478 RepID=A0ABT4RF32_9ACTN|nr:FAD-dependent oxidoreductase [Solirubrobacter deserti]MBE2318664.1 FAD-binding oxidoreductase [Solirubrobacter deserti]MDA0137122.1 FAD-binding oxidoreductase [Solirubrobacter deserti]